MITIKLKSLETDKTKYIKREDGYPAQVGDKIIFKWNKTWKVLKITCIPNVTIKEDKFKTEALQKELINKYFLKKEILE